MTILQRYIFREWLWSLLGVSLILLTVLMGVFLGELLNDMADGRIPAGLLGVQLLLYLPDAFVNILPVSAFVAVMWSLGRLYRDREMVVMRSSGFGWRQLLRPLLLLCVPVALLLVLLTFYVAPRAAERSEQALEEALRSAAIWGVQAGKFHALQGGDLVIYVESLGSDGRTLSNVFVQQREGMRRRVWQAASGEYWMDEGTGRAGELIAAVDAASRAELQGRISPALAVLVLSLLAIPRSHSDPREGRGSRVVLGILSYAIYANLLYLCRAWVVDGTLPAWLGLWWVHALVLLSALFWLQRQGRAGGLVPRARGGARHARGLARAHGPVPPFHAAG
ncbi:MAG: LptF/LptG family permease [Gammaproteobacteria bacterium]